MGIIYFLQRADGDIKIGTTIRYDMRLSELITQYSDLLLLGMMEGESAEEQALHKQFAKYRRNRTEFFEPAEELLDYIRNKTSNGKSTPTSRRKLQQKREQRRVDIASEIKDIARRQMAENGTATLSLRAIALEMKMTAPAIYRYFENRDALITALIVDAFNALADALELARDSHPSGDPVERLVAVMLAYREWAITHPSDFQLIYGNPIPGYHAPREVTVPTVVRGFVVTIGLLSEIMQTHRLRPPYVPIPEALRAHFEAMIADGGYPITEEAFYVGTMMWTQFHGIIMLELFNHIQANVGDVELYYRTQMKLIFSTTLSIDS